MRTALIIIAGAVAVLLVIAVAAFARFVSKNSKYDSTVECPNPADDTRIVFADGSVLCVQTDEPTLLLDRAPFSFARRPGRKYYLLDLKDVTDEVGGEVEAKTLKNAEEIAGESVPRRRAPKYFLAVG